MEFRTYILCCTLFSSIAAYTLQHGLTNLDSSDNLVEVAQNSGCECKNGRCVKDNKGKTKCKCKGGYALQDENTCELCDCGKRGKCMFIPLAKSAGGLSYLKKCLCDVGSAEKDGICIDCHCGENSQCEFEEGEKNCYCIDGYAEKDGVCTKCDCGSNGECTFKNGHKICTCDEDFVEVDGYCVDKCENYLCENDGTCEIHSGMPICKCDDRYTGDHCEKDKCADINCYNGGRCEISDGEAVCECTEIFTGKTCETSKCSMIMCYSTGECYIQDGIPLCKCREGYYGEMCENDECSRTTCHNGGRCYMEHGKAFCQCLERFEGEWCEKDKCGSYLCENGGICEVPADGLPRCICEERYTGDICEIDKCDVLECQNGGKCKIEEGLAVCDCHPKYTGKKCEKETCSMYYPCQNGGACDDGFCICLLGTSGGFCDVIDECPNLCPKRSDVNCTYDIKNEKAYCDCLDRRLGFHLETKECRRTCEESECKNGGECQEIGYSRFCSCLEGTEGDFCEIVPGCQNMDCGKEATCLYDPDKKSGFCQCYDSKLVLNPNDRTCRKSCQESECSNGGTCVITRGDLGYCRCLEGTKGDSCEEVPGCVNKECGDNSKCKYDVERRIAICKCVDDNSAFDPVDFRCKMPCTHDSLCKNGGVCKSRGHHRFCQCQEGTSGSFCENVDICNERCGTTEGVVCKYDLSQMIAECLCQDKNYEFDAVTKSCKQCDCGGKEISCNIQNGRKICICPDGYSAKDGKCKKQSCIERKCLHGKCEVLNDKEICTCFEGYFLDGDECRKKTCTQTPCLNGTCIVRYGGLEECICQAGYTLTDSACIRGSCRPDTCYGGECQTIDGELTCICPKKFHLEGIGCYETVCKIHRCFGGKCVVENGEEICTCREGYVLENDVCKQILCEKKNCFGGQCHIRGGVEECECLPGYSIFEDVCVRDNTR